MIDLRGLLNRFWLRDAEALSTRVAAAVRPQLARQVVRARQRIDAAKLLWASEYYVEALQLGDEGLGETKRAVELAGEGWPGGPPATPPSDRAWAQTLLMLGASPKRIAALESLEGSRRGTLPVSNDQVTQDDRTYFHAAAAASEGALSAVAPLVRPPSQITASRAARVGILAAIGAIVIWMVVPRGPRAEASASYPMADYSPSKVMDGNARTEWLLPNLSTGWIEITMRPRPVHAVRLLNGHNPPFNDRSAHDIRVELSLGKKVVFTAKHAFADFSPAPGWVRVPIPTAVKADKIRIYIDSYFKSGGALAEVIWE